MIVLPPLNLQPKLSDEGNDFLSDSFGEHLYLVVLTRNSIAVSFINTKTVTSQLISLIKDHTPSEAGSSESTEHVRASALSAIHIVLPDSIHALVVVVWAHHD